MEAKWEKMTSHIVTSKFYSINSSQLNGAEVVFHVVFFVWTKCACKVYILVHLHKDFINPESSARPVSVFYVSLALV